MLLIASRWEGLLTFSQFLTRIVWPVQYIVDLPTQIRELAEPLLIRQDHLARANDTLQHEQIFLQAQVQKLRALEAENQELRELLKSVSSNKESFSEARLIHTNVDPFMQQILLNKGKAHGIEMGQPVIDSFGLVGVVTGLNQYTSQVLLVTDPGFAVPIQSVRSGERAIASGSGSGGELRLNYVPRTADFIEGDILVTSGIGGRFPAGYPVGMITSIQHDPSTRFTLVGISPIAKLGQLRHVLFVKHEPQLHSIETTPPVLAQTKNEAESVVPAVTSIPAVVPAPAAAPAETLTSAKPVVSVTKNEEPAKIVKTAKAAKTEKVVKTEKAVKTEKVVNTGKKANTVAQPAKTTTVLSHLKGQQIESKAERKIATKVEPQSKVDLATVAESIKSVELVEPIATVSSEEIRLESKPEPQLEPESTVISSVVPERTQEVVREITEEITKEIRHEQELAVELPAADPTEHTP